MRLAFIPCPTSVGFFRSTQPAHWLSQTGRHEVAVLDTAFGIPKEVQPDLVRSADVIAMSWAPTKTNADAPEFAERRGALTLDFDDDCFSFATDPSLAYVGDEAPLHSDPERLAKLEAWVRAADLITVSTPHLVDVFLKHGAKEVAVCPNALSPEMQRETPRPQSRGGSIIELSAAKRFLEQAKQGGGSGRVFPRSAKVVGWTGAISKALDVAPMLVALRRLALVEPQLCVASVGPIDLTKLEPWQGITKKELRYFWAKVRDAEGQESATIPFAFYYEILESLAPEVACIPLRPSPFNLGKSAITLWGWSYQEVPVICSKVGPYAEAAAEGFPAVYIEKHDDADEWFTAIRDLLSNPMKARRIGEEAKAFVEKHHLMPDALAPWEAAFERACEIRKATCPTFAATAAPKPSSQCPPPEEGASGRCA